MSLQRDLEHTRPGSRLVAGRNFLYSCSISLDVLFSCCISVDGCLPVDLLHCSCTTSPAAAVSSSLPAPTQHHQSIAQNSLFGLTHWYAMWYAHYLSWFASSEENSWNTFPAILVHVLFVNSMFTNSFWKIQMHYLSTFVIFLVYETV